jgi:hypothetical protein
LKSCGAQKQNLCQTKAESKVQHRQCIIPTSSTEQRQSGEQVMKSETSQRQNKEKIKHETPAQKKWRKLRVAGPKLKEVFGRGTFRGEIQACSNLNWISKFGRGAPRIKTEGYQELLIKAPDPDKTAPPHQLPNTPVPRHTTSRQKSSNSKQRAVPRLHHPARPSSRTRDQIERRQGVKSSIT